MWIRHVKYACMLVDSGSIIVLLLFQHNPAARFQTPAETPAGGKNFTSAASLLLIKIVHIKGPAEPMHNSFNLVYIQFYRGCLVEVSD
jgi:hypothetical protein